MNDLLQPLLLALCFLNFLLLASSSLKAGVQWVGWQGLAVGLLPLFSHPGGISGHLWAFAGASILVKAVVFPWLLFLAIREVKVRREILSVPILFTGLLGGAAALGLAFHLSSRLPGLPHSGLAVPAGFFTVGVGFLLLILRRTALLQVTGYLVLENGIFVLGVSLALEQPLLVEMGILLDLLVAGFVMGVMLFQIQREFDHLDTHQLSQLKDL